MLTAATNIAPTLEADELPEYDEAEMNCRLHTISTQFRGITSPYEAAELANKFVEKKLLIKGRDYYQGEHTTYRVPSLGTINSSDNIVLDLHGSIDAHTADGYRDAGFDLYFFDEFGRNTKMEGRDSHKALCKTSEKTYHENGKIARLETYKKEVMTGYVTEIREFNEVGQTIFHSRKLHQSGETKILVDVGVNSGEVSKKVADIVGQQ